MNSWSWSRKPKLRRFATWSSGERAGLYPKPETDTGIQYENFDKAGLFSKTRVTENITSERVVCGIPTTLECYLKD